MTVKKQTLHVTRKLKLTRSHKILALIPAKNACSDDSSTSDDEANAYITPSPDTFDPPSIASSLEALNLLNSSTDSNKEDDIGLPLTPILTQIFPSPNTSNYNIIPTMNSNQSLSSPTVEQPLRPIISQQQQQCLPDISSKRCQKM